MPILGKDWSPMDEEHIEKESPEELQAEEETLQDVEEDELRSKLAEDYGIDPEEGSELLDKMVAKEKESRKRLQAAIRQKRNWRERAEKGTSKKPNSGEGKTQTSKGLTPEEVDERFKTLMEQRDLESLSLPEEVEADVKTLAKIKNISVKEAAKDPYIQSRLQAIEQEEKIKKGTPRRGNKGGYIPSGDPSKAPNPEDYDFSKKEDRDAWAEAKAAHRKYLAQNSK